MKYLLLLLLLSGCSMKTISKNCVRAGDTEYSVCDSLNGLGK